MMASNDSKSASAAKEEPVMEEDISPFWATSDDIQRLNQDNRKDIKLGFEASSNTNTDVCVKEEPLADGYAPMVVLKMEETQEHSDDVPDPDSNMTPSREADSNFDVDFEQESCHTQSQKKRRQRGTLLISGTGGEQDDTQVSSASSKVRKKTKYKPCPSVCSLCNRTFATPGTLTRHKRKHTGERPHRCSECDSAFASARDLKIHMRTHTGEKPYSCLKCYAAFSTAGGLRVHVRTHTGEKPYLCTECNATFTTSWGLTIHTRNHTGERPYTCTECVAAFTQSCRLKDHMLRKHTKVHVYSNPDSNETFVKSWSLKIHPKIHTRDKPYSCTECKTELTLHHNLNVHANKHTGLMAYSCPRCEATFTIGMQSI